LRPMMPTNSPERAVKETPRTAATETICLRRSLPSRSLRGARSVRITLYRTRTLCATTVTGDSSGATQRSASALFGAIRLLPLPEEQQSEEGEPRRPRTEDQPMLYCRDSPVHEHLAVHHEHVVDRVDFDQCSDSGVAVGETIDR